MSNKLPVSLSLLIVLLSAAEARAETRDMTGLVSKCMVNPDCAATEPDATGGVRFRIETRGTIQSMYCISTEKCERLRPRSQRVLVADPVAFVSER